MSTQDSEAAAITESSAEEYVLGESSPADELDTFYVEWARESLKRNLPFVNEVLRGLVTLDTALLGGSVLWLGPQIVPAWFRLAVVLCFLLSLAAAFWGMLPYTGTAVDLRCPDLIHKHKTEALRTKQFWVWVAAWCLIAGFAVALVGLLARMVWPAP
jgi:hypothetical protein